MPAWWTTRTPREQVLIGIAAAIASVVVLWLGVWRPLAAAHDAARERYERAATIERRVEVASAQIAALRRAARRPPAPMAAAAALTAEGEAVGVAFSRMEDDPAGGVRVVIDSVAPMTLFPLLVRLQREHGVAAQHLTVAKSANAVSVDAIFTGPADGG